MSAPIVNPAIPQLPSGDLQRTADFYRDRLGFADLKLFPEHRHLIVRRRPVEIHFWHAGSEEEAKHYGSASSCYIRVHNIVPLYEELRCRGRLFATAWPINRGECTKCRSMIPLESDPILRSV